MASTPDPAPLSPRPPHAPHICSSIVLPRSSPTFSPKRCSAPKPKNCSHPAGRTSTRFRAEDWIPTPTAAQRPTAGRRRNRHFENTRPTGPLVHSGLGRTRPVFAGWLGVTMYLTGKAIEATLAGFAPARRNRRRSHTPAGTARRGRKRLHRSRRAGRRQARRTLAPVPPPRRWPGCRAGPVRNPRTGLAADALRPIALSMLTRARIPEPARIGHPA